MLEMYIKCTLEYFANHKCAFKLHISGTFRKHRAMCLLSKRNKNDLKCILKYFATFKYIFRAIVARRLIDTLFPISKGQRELVIGDRQNRKILF